MKKTIIYLSLALLAVGNVTFASNNIETTPKVESTVKYNVSTPLAMAICKGDVETVKKFIEYGVDVNEKSNGLTPLMLAARYNQVEIINILIENNARLDTKDERGNTALKYAELFKAKDAALALKNARA
ncbi:MAG: hypothetical protein BM557_11435 [Flavobacterium sp. MedPE-SWcel]|uniref:ankyrin repeat domain-containing protein n=1 Tax=uncultured Flavobacterium sp. TaxID=165435 RepID=UPI0009220A3E|nr:ankyrin repeat domain-containing protein [uncultured Flavobacterium sp.]OIQ15374.1 MAG: hypothetical protein BM557_11435 [Flavobacterium sp. MedPE-SWcel]